MEEHPVRRHSPCKTSKIYSSFACYFTGSTVVTIFLPIENFVRTKIRQVRIEAWSQLVKIQNSFWWSRARNNQVSRSGTHYKIGLSFSSGRLSLRLRYCSTKRPNDIFKIWWPPNIASHDDVCEHATFGCIFRVWRWMDENLKGHDGWLFLPSKVVLADRNFTAAMADGGWRMADRKNSLPVGTGTRYVP